MTTKSVFVIAGRSYVSIAEAPFGAIRQQPATGRSVLHRLCSRKQWRAN